MSKQTYSVEDQFGTAVSQGIRDRRAAAFLAQSLANDLDAPFYVVAEGGPYEPEEYEPYSG